MVNTSTPELYRQYTTDLQRIADIKYAAAVLQWDQETYMPASSLDTRARQIASLTEMAHNLFTTDKTGNLLEELSQRDNLSEDEKSNVSLSLYDYKKEKKLSAAFVRNLSETISRSYQAWMDARHANRFAVFEDDLGKLIELKKQEAAQLGYEGHPYNALLNEYERGCTVAELDNNFEVIRQPLKTLIDRITQQPQVNDGFLHQHFDKDQQWKFGMDLVRRLGFDLNAGRQDISEHPFTTNFSSRDVRITTRIDESNFGNMTWSCLHELGHALYEQGLPIESYGLPLSEYASLSIHESQSRLWENNVGRSEVFWKYYLPVLKAFFPVQFETVDLRSFYCGINKVEPTFIRTEADELTYHFHVMIRYELEKLLISGSLSAKDIPAYWNEQYASYLGLVVPDDRQGCLQDVHWSHGSFGYFPTYSLGSLYAAQFFDTAGQELAGLADEIASGSTVRLLKWLRDRIHGYGRKFSSSQLCRQITGETLNARYFIDNATRKYQDIYKFR